MDWGTGQMGERRVAAVVVAIGGARRQRRGGAIRGGGRGLVVIATGSDRVDGVRRWQRSSGVHW